MHKKGFAWNPATCTCENGKYFKSIINDSVIRCNEIVKATKTISTNTFLLKIILVKYFLTNFNEKK